MKRNTVSRAALGLILALMPPPLTVVLVAPQEAAHAQVVFPDRPDGAADP